MRWSGLLSVLEHLGIRGGYGVQVEQGGRKKSEDWEEWEMGRWEMENVDKGRRGWILGIGFYEVI